MIYEQRNDGLLVVVVFLIPSDLLVAGPEFVGVGITRVGFRLHRLHHVELCRCLLRSHKTAEEVGLEIARDNTDFRAAEEEFVGALVGTRMRQHST